MNLCVTLNACLDKTLVVPPWQAGEHQVRGTSFSQVVGGKGNNIARGLSRLGHPARPALLLGGDIGRLCERLLREQDGFDPIVSWTESATRVMLTVKTAGTADQTAFFDPNPKIAPTEIEDLGRQLDDALRQDARWCVMSGSSPCGVTDDFYAQLVTRARELGVRTLVDTYGMSLTNALLAGPDVVKLNQRECEQELNLALDSASAVRHALRLLLQSGSMCAAITLGSRGVAAAWEDAVCAWKPPSIKVINPIGAGDAMAAGLVDAFTRELDPPAAFRWAIACAVSSVEQWAACDIRPAKVRSMADRIAECSVEDLMA